MLKITQSSFGIAIKTYPNLSSFAIVTDEDLTCFDITINENLFFADMIAGKATNENFWNTAKWQSEDFCHSLPNLQSNLNNLYNLINDLKEQSVSEY